MFPTSESLLKDFVYKYYSIFLCYFPLNFFSSMTTRRANKRPQNEESEPQESDNSNISDSDAILGLSDKKNNNHKIKEKKRYKLETSNYIP